jgi:predicted DNA binding CopG/RHH family protein
MRTVQFAFQPKSERVNMRAPTRLLDAARRTRPPALVIAFRQSVFEFEQGAGQGLCGQAGIPCQRFIRQALEAIVQQDK